MFDIKFMNRAFDEFHKLYIKHPRVDYPLFLVSVFFMQGFGLSLQIVPNFTEVYVAKLIGADLLI